MVQRYLDSIPITSESDAKVLGSSSGWEILEELRDAGIDGLMVNEIADKLDLPTSTVYSVLRQLNAAGFVKTKRYKKKSERRTRNDWGMNYEPERKRKSIWRTSTGVRFHLMTISDFL